LSTTPTYKINYPQTPFLDPTTQMPSLPWQLWLQNPSVSTITVGGTSSGGIYSGVAITASTIDSTTIGATTPSTGVFTSLQTTQTALGYDKINASSGGNYTFGNNTVVVLNGSGAISGFSITMPSAPLDGQLALISTNQPISSLSVNPNGGQTLNNPATSLTGGQGAGYIFTSNAWFRIY
jgi:hypothetical protein